MVFAEKLDRFRRYDGPERACHANVAPCAGGHLCLRIGRAFFMPSMCLLYAFYVPSMCLLCALYLGRRFSAAMSCRRWPGRWRASVAAGDHYIIKNPALHIGVWWGRLFWTLCLLRRQCSQTFFLWVVIDRWWLRKHYLLHLLHCVRRILPVHHVMAVWTNGNQVGVNVQFVLLPY